MIIHTTVQQLIQSARMITKNPESEALVPLPVLRRIDQGFPPNGWNVLTFRRTRYGVFQGQGVFILHLTGS